MSTVFRPPQISWPTAAVLIATLASIVACFGLLSPEYQPQALSLVGSLGAVALAAMRALYAHKEPPPGPPDPLNAFATPPSGVSRNGAMKPRKTMLSLRARATLAGLLFLPVLPGCGASALQTHATVASLAAASIDTACDAVQTARAHDQDEALEHAAFRDEAQSAVDAVRLRWEPAVDGCRALASAHDAWVEGLSLAAAGAPFDAATGLRLASLVLRVWDDLTPIFASLGVALPIAPVELRGLTVSP